MIRIKLQPEPEYFDLDIRKKGALFLKNPKDRQELPDYWKKCRKDLYLSYGGVCAYYSIGIDEITGSCTIDHFRPKSKYPQLAYEWNNYRLACGVANSCKRDFEDVLDPFDLPEDLFQIYFDDGEIYVNSMYSQEIQNKAKETIDRLKLNDHRMKRRRAKDFYRYQKKEIFQQELKQQNPFVWKEILRQNLVICE